MSSAPHVVTAALRRLHEGGERPLLAGHHGDELCLQLLDRGGLVSGVAGVDSRLTLATPQIPVSLLGRLLSLLLPDWWIWLGQAGLTARRGGWTHWITLPQRYEEVERARRLAETVTGKSPGPASTSGAARALLRWTGVSQPARYDSSARHLREGLVRWPYYRAIPGYYPGPYALWDCSGYHYNIGKRLPSPKCYIDSQGKLQWLKLTKGEKIRWHTLFEKIEEEKGVRNSLIGAMYSSGGGQYYVNGRRREWAGKKEGPLYNGASVVFRTAAELAARAAVDDVDGRLSPYVAVDGVASLSRTPPRAWADVGLPVTIKKQGDLDVLYLHAYRVGQDATERYQEVKKWERETGRRSAYRPKIETRLPGREYWPWMLGAAA